MKIFVACKSHILQKTLDLYLADSLAPYEDCEFVISDNIDEGVNKPICLASFGDEGDIKRPIYRESLWADLERFYKHLNAAPRVDLRHFNAVLDTSELENLKKSLDSINGAGVESSDEKLKSDIESIVQDFANRLYEAIKSGK